MRYIVLAALVACGHATTTEDQPKAGDNGEKKAEQKTAQATVPSHATSTTTREMFKRDGLKKLQDKLGAKQTGVLDDQTQKRLKDYQEKEGIATTGMPDYESVRRLGLEPDEVFHSQPPAKRIGVK